LYGDIENLVEWENAGFTTDWDHYCYQVKRLFQVWRNAEHEIKTIRANLHAVYIKGQFKE